MISISLCMIVKNEEQVLARCLDSVAPLMDELIIVDTGSTDRTREIAAQYTDRIYDFDWCDDFAAARNYAFSLASMDYIYAPDADECLDPVNQERFLMLKEALLPAIEIVQMRYVTPTDYNTVQNCKHELRPKLFKRLRTFTWVDPVHETIRTEPVIYDSDIEIMHLPHSLHCKRDFTLFEKAFHRDGSLSEKVASMYAKELFKCGEYPDFLASEDFFLQNYEQTASPEAASVLAHIARLKNDTDSFFSICLKDMAGDSCSEICYELGYYYMSRRNYREASLWFYNAVYETEAVLDIEIPGQKALLALADCYQNMAEQCDPESYEHDRLLEDASDCRMRAENWQLPEEL